MEKIDFINHETKKKLSLKLDKDFIIVFGKNGAGKTTLSRAAPDQDCVFNTDFIYRNIYIESSNGAKDDTNTKESFSSLWIGEDIVTLRKELKDIRDKKKALEEKRKGFESRIFEEYAKSKIDPLDIVRLSKNIETLPFERKPGQTDEDIITNHKASTALETDIKDSSELQERIARFSEQTAMKILVETLQKSSLLNELLLSEGQNEQRKFLALLFGYRDAVSTLKAADNAFKSKDKQKESEWIRNGLELHESIDECLFCGTKNISEAKEHWAEIIKSKANFVKQKLIDYLQLTLEICKKISDDSDKYESIAKNTCSSIKILERYFVILKDSVEENKELAEELQTLPTDLARDPLACEKEKALVQIQNFIFRSAFIDQFEALVLLAQDYQNQEKAKDAEITSSLSSKSKIIENDINEFLVKLDLNKELGISIDKRGNDRKYSFNFKNAATKIDTLSDGQKHKLALAIFLAKISKMDLKSKVVVLDDPIATMDQRAYHAVKRLVCDLRCNNQPRCLIILTYNLAYLQVQLSNLFNKPEIEGVKMIHLYPDHLSEIDPEILNYDDLTLYKKCLDRLKTPEEYSILASMNTRIYRYYLDFLSRMNGIPSSSCPADEIKKFGFEQDKVKDLINRQNQITHISRDKKATNEDLYNGFEETNRFIVELGFPPFLDSDKLNFLSSFANKNERCHSYSGNELLFEIAFRAIQIMNSDTSEKYGYIKNYMNHPRSQITSTIIGIDFSDAEYADFEERP